MFGVEWGGVQRGVLRGEHTPLTLFSLSHTHSLFLSLSRTHTHTAHARARSLSLETKIGDILPWDEIADEAERLLESDQATRRAPDDDQVDKEQEGDQEVDRDDTDTHMNTVFGRRRPDSIAVEWNNKVLC